MSSRKNRNGGHAEGDARENQQTAQPSRHSALPVSSSTGPDLGDALPRVASALYERLVRRGLSVEDAKDVVQEVLTRALQYPKGFSSARGFERWAFVVARNLVYDRESEQRRLLVGEVPTVELPDPAEVVGERLLVDEVLRSGASLSERDRRAIAAAVRNLRPREVSEQKRFNVVLHRARRRLFRRIEGGLTGMLLRWRWWLDEVAHTAGAVTAPAFLGAVVAVAGGSVPAAAEAPVRVATAPAAQLVGAPAQEALAQTRTSTENVGRPPAPVVRPPDPAPPLSPVEPEPPQTYQRVEVPAPDGPLVEAETQENRPEYEFLCLYNIPRVGSPCLDIPTN